MKRRFRCPVETKKELVAEVLSGYRTEFVARRHGVNPSTLGNWVRQYRDEVDDIMERKRKQEEQLLRDAARLKELEQKYQEALKLLGEKDVEISILRELVKKKVSRWELAIAWINKGYPVRTILRICGIPRSTYYYRLKHPERRKSSNGGRPIPGYSYDKDDRKVPDARIKMYLRHLLSGPHAASGYRKLTKLLRRKYDLVINKKKVYRLCKEMGVLFPQRVVRHTAPKKIARNRVVTGPDQLWQMDIKYGYVAGKRRHFYVASIIDVSDRQVVSHYRGKTCKTEHVIKTLQKALLKRNIHAQDTTLVIRTDNGPQFKSKAFQRFCAENNIEHERIPGSMPNKNAYIEAFHSILEMECFLRNCFETYEEAFAEVDRFMRFYNNERLHGSLYDLPPKEYAELVEAGQLPIRKIAL